MELFAADTEFGVCRRPTQFAGFWLVVWQRLGLGANFSAFHYYSLGRAYVPNVTKIGGGAIFLFTSNRRKL